MSLQIDSSLINPITVAAPEAFVDLQAPHPAAPAPIQTHSGAPAKTITDDVTLSLSARIHLLKDQGNSNNQIAIALNVDTATVASYLGTTTTPVTAPASAPIPGAPATT